MGDERWRGNLAQPACMSRNVTLLYDHAPNPRMDRYQKKIASPDSKALALCLTLTQYDEEGIPAQPYSIVEHLAALPPTSPCSCVVACAVGVLLAPLFCFYFTMVALGSALLFAYPPL